MDSEDLLTTYEIMGKLTPFTGHGMMILQGGNKLYLKQLVISRAEKNRAYTFFTERGFLEAALIATKPS